MQTHISYKTSKRLKEFLGRSAPEPMEDIFWFLRYETQGIGHKYHEPTLVKDKMGLQGIVYPAYQLHDLLSKPFCEAFIKERFARGLNHEAAAWELTGHLERMINEYYSTGLPAVERALCEMMGDSRNMVKGEALK